MRKGTETVIESIMSVLYCCCFFYML